MPRSKIGQPVGTGRKPSGVLVVVEGMDGVGKSTLVSALEETLTAQNIPVYCTQEPTRGPFGTMLRERQASGIRYTPWEEYWLFMLDRVAHGREIRQHLAQGSVVLSDRYWHSTWVYQVPRMLEHQEQNLLQERRDILVQEATGVTPTPDLLCILDLSVEEAQKRILAARGALDVFERADLFAQYRVDYQCLAESQNGLLLSADHPLEVLVEKVCKCVLHLREISISTLL